ncbi:FkbM family methyltransferase [Roseimicrobium gellanilyticum]|uniref:FkbM family methyltransferase n=1 Tax=Roseimicrobium gellanilyticum TaxID=748857 RepID=A0A366HN83_9BACT|nr:FkbM family methyltransferase [Roseimicrobium gellanilyticum]RBP43896.1 FkbM family methyltransferase [Roseimicrobium gellanilyticum]
MTRPRFSVVIPTRNAEATLGATLRTCLEQEFEDYEILVSDNSATTATQELLAGINSSRIRCVRPDRTLSMQENWEFAVEQAQGEFVLVLGSDDGLMLHSLRELDRLLRMLDTKLLRWDSVCYHWPTVPVQAQLPPNALLLPLKQMDSYHPIRWRDSRAVMLDAAHGRVSYAELPTVYSSAVHHSLLDELRKQTGKVFHGDCPDVYSGFALAHLVKRYCSLDAPLSINGLSGVSNGVATIFLKNSSPIAEDFNALNHARKAGRGWQEWIPDLSLFSTCSAHSFQCAKERLFPEDAELSMCRRELAQRVMREYRSASETEWQMVRGAVRKSMVDDASLLAWFDSEYADKSLAACPPADRYPLKHYGGAYMQLDAAEFGVKDVWEAALLCEKLLGYRQEGINAHLKADGATALERSKTNNGAVPGAPREGLYQQETEVAILKILAGKVTRKTFIDVGAEKGSFAREFLKLGFDGVLFEPFATHLPVLEKLVSGTRSKVLPLAIDATDHEGQLHIATDQAGQPLEYFHSLQPAPSATNFFHGAAVPVTCRSLESLVREGTIARDVGILKIDTEGNDLRVLQGMGPVRAEVLMCEYVTPRLYPDWSCSFPEGVMDAAKAMGYEHCIAVSRFDEHEVVENDPVHFVDGQWGNLIFISDALLRSAQKEIDDIQRYVHREHVKACLRDHQVLLEKEARIQDQATVCLDQQRRLDERRAKIEELKVKNAVLKEKNERLRTRC